MILPPRIKKLAVALFFLWLVTAWPVFKGAFPLQVGEAFFAHEHCITGLMLAFRVHSTDLHGQYPVHTNGYADALLLLNAGWVGYITGPGYDVKLIEDAVRNKRNIPEEQSGRVYIQGLSEKIDPPVCMVFDKIFHPGDHTHFFSRFTEKPRREVIMSNAEVRHIIKADWPSFAAEQVARLAELGFDRGEVEKLFFAESATPRAPIQAKIAFALWIATGAILGWIGLRGIVRIFRRGRFCSSLPGGV